MLASEHHWREIGDLFDEAGLGGGWDKALNGLADACGGVHGQLIGLSAEPAIRFNWLPRLEPRTAEEFGELVVSGPSASRRVRLRMRSPELETWHDVDDLASASSPPDGSLEAFRRRHDIPFASQTNLAHDRSGVISLAVLRTKAQGAPSHDDRRAFEALAPRAQAAVKLQRALEGRGAQLLSGTLDGLGRAAFVCDDLGTVCARTPQTEPLLEAGVLRLSGGRLTCADQSASRRLDQAIASARREPAPSERPAVQTLVLRHGASEAVRVADVIALPRAAYAFGFEPRLLVVVRGGRNETGDTEPLLQAAYGLTPSEARIAVQLGAGESPAGIALSRRVSDGTIRSQVRSIYQKMDVRRQVEFAARLAALR